MQMTYEFTLDVGDFFIIKSNFHHYDDYDDYRLVVKVSEDSCDLLCFNKSSGNIRHRNDCYRKVIITESEKEKHIKRMCWISREKPFIKTKEQ